jgi:PPOX class probable F420-dependent enzyme
MTIPKEIRGQKYISLTTYRKNGQAVNTPVWFAEQGEKLYVKTRNDSGKYKRIRNNPQIKIAACSMGGKITGPEFAATARILPVAQWPEATQALHRKYWLSRLPFWSKKNEFLEIEVDALDFGGQ